MRGAQISGLVSRKRGRTTIRVPGVRVADDLVERQFRPQAPNVLWCADITYLRSWEGWLYLAAVQDLYSRRIVGWSMANHMRSDLVVDALRMAVARRRPETGLIHHSDQGSQYVSLAFGQTARDAGIAVSMGSKGDCYDNAVAESFFATLKKELVNRSTWPTRAEQPTAVFDYIEIFYNATRRHSTLGMLSPTEIASICSSHFPAVADPVGDPKQVLLRTDGLCEPLAIGVVEELFDGVLDLSQLLLDAIELLTYGSTHGQRGGVRGNDRFSAVTIETHDVSYPPLLTADEPKHLPGLGVGGLVLLELLHRLLGESHNATSLDIAIGLTGDAFRADSHHAANDLSQRTARRAGCSLPEPAALERF